MNHCEYCGAEFDGSFCPQCGSSQEKEKECPNCGSKCKGDAKFCNSCGYQFTLGTTSAKEEKPASIVQQHKIIELIFVFGFLLFSALLFLIYIAPVAVIPNFFESGSGGLGNIYRLSTLEGSSNIKYISIILIALASFSSLVALFNLGAFIINKESSFGCWCFSILLLLAFIICSAIIIGRINNLGLTDFVKSGACPILLLIFSCLFLLLLIPYYIITYRYVRYQEKQEH